MDKPGRCFNLKLRILLALFIGIFSYNAECQYYSSGQDPAGIKWKTIKTTTHRLIFPDFFEHEAQRAARFLEYTAINDTFTLKPRIKPVDVVFHPFTTISNAVVPWAPARIDYYTVPPQDSYSQDWFEQLALHEHRHVLQYNSMKKGFGKFLYYLTGEQSSALLLGLFVPFWAIEGDAVTAETALSKTGRGRLPSFEMPLKAQILKKGIYPYDKAVFGSYKNFIPDHYILGYQLVGNGIAQYGTDFLKTPLTNVSRFPFMVVPFSEGIRKETSLTKTGFYQNILKSLKDEWVSDSVNTDLYEAVSGKPKRIYTDYRKPVSANQRIFAIKKSMDEVEKIVELLPNQKDSLIFTPGYIQPESLTISGNLMAWAETQFDPRWQNRDYSVIRLLNLETNESRYLTNKSRVFSPALSADGLKIAVVDVSLKNEYSLKIVETSSGTVISQFNTVENYFLMTPSWSDNGQSIVVTALGKAGKTFLIFDSDGRYHQVMPFTFEEISRPAIQDDFIYYSASYSGIDNIYRINIPTGRTEQITKSRFGAFEPNISSDGSQLHFAEYTADGYQISRLKISKSSPDYSSVFERKSLPLSNKLSKAPFRVFDFNRIEDKKYPVKKYSRLRNLINPHSWGPFSLDADNLELNPGISILSQNVLNTSFLNAGYKWDMNRESGKWYMKYSYEGLYPVFDFEIENGIQKGFGRKFDTIDSQLEIITVPVKWRVTNYSAALRVPLSFVSGVWLLYIQPFVSLTYFQADILNDPGILEKSQNIKTLVNELTISNYIKSTEWDYYPRFGQNFRLYYRTAPFNKGWSANLFAFSESIFIPGIFRHHGIKLNISYQERNEFSGIFTEYIPNIRGYEDFASLKLQKFSVDYWLPIIYPDLSISSLLYFKRISANLFFDYSNQKNKSENFNLQSYGADILTRVHILRFFAPISLGARIISRPQSHDFKFYFLYSINFSLF